MTDNFELLDIGQIEIMHQQVHDRIDDGEDCNQLRPQHDALAAELVKRGLPHDTVLVCDEIVTDAPNFRRGFTDQVCGVCAFGQLFPLCNLYNFDYLNKENTCDSFQDFEVLELNAPHGYLMLSEKQTAIANDEKLDISKPKLIISKGEAFGIAVLDDPAQIKTKEFDSEEWKKQHRITPRERRQWWGSNDTFYVYRLKEWYSFGKSRIYEDNIIKDVKLTSEQWKKVSKAKELPNQIILVDNAVNITEDSVFVIDPNVGYSQELLDSLKATYECDVLFDTFSGKKEYEIPIYSLALVRNHKARPIKKKQEEEIMPFRIRKRGDEYCVIKINDDDSDGESQGCHDTNEEAQAQLTALNINVTAEEDRSAHPKPRKKKPKKKEIDNVEKIASMEWNNLKGTKEEVEHYNEIFKQFSVDEYPGMLRRQFQNKFNLDGRDVQPLEIFSSDSIPNMAGFIIANKDGGLFRIDYVTNDMGTTFADETQWIEVVPDFRPKGFTQVANYEKKIEEKEAPGLMDKVRSFIKDISEYLKPDQEVYLTSKKNEQLYTGDTKVMQKEVGGELWHFTWSTNAFEDREGEIFSTKSLEKYVEENETKENKGYFNLWHINAEDGNFNTDFARKEWQGVVGRFLIEAGPYLDDHKGQSAKKFFSEFSDGHPEIAPEGWGCSPEFRYLPEERATGIYENIWITRTSTLPKMAAANIWTDTGQARHKMAISESQMKTAIAAFGPEEVKLMIEQAEQKTTELEDANIAHKTVELEGVVESFEIDIPELAKEIGKQFQTDINPLSEAVENVTNAMVKLSERVKELEGTQKLKDLTETPKYIVSLRASESDETIVTEDDGLKNKRPQGVGNEAKGANVTPQAFFTPS